MLSLLTKFAGKFAGKSTMPKCTYCGGTDFLEGPSGGMSTNILCANEKCRHWFNWTPLLSQLDDLNRVEPTDEERAKAKATAMDKTKADAETRFQEGRNAYHLGQRIGACGGSGANGGYYPEEEGLTNIRRNKAYGSYAEPAVNIDRLAGFMEAMADDIRELKRANGK